jgi:hypothetical protein
VIREPLPIDPILLQVMAAAATAHYNRLRNRWHTPRPGMVTAQ